LTVVWLRYVVIAEQLGLSGSSTSGTFSEPSSSLIWSLLGPTIVLNLLIWGLGTLYSWAASEKVPSLREAYRELQRAERRLGRLRRLPHNPGTAFWRMPSLRKSGATFRSATSGTSSGF
jgi:hypothetical protein